MGKLIRFGVSMDKDLIERFDGLIKEEGYINRSEAIRDLIRERLVEEEWEEDDEVCGGILLVYDHHKHHLSEKITEIQHHFYKLVISTQHIHMDHDNCMEIISIRGKARDIKNFFNKLRATTGIKQCDIIKATVGDRIK
ncbi:MAG: nickel-responsive transcriptional regulator NikR [candidate division WOR-3 bacterium]